MVRTTFTFDAIVIGISMIIFYHLRMPFIQFLAGILVLNTLINSNKNLEWDKKS
ncbi:MAG: hypothetical protein K2G70_01575 [Turicibacter sp.]|nr:hypothetical protein [Turicibacter sp.]